MFSQYVSKKTIGEKMSKEDNKNYMSVTVVSIITLIVSGLSIYLLINIFN